MKKISKYFGKSQRRSQIGLEYMAIVSITTLIAISLLAMSHYYSRETESTINVNQIDMIAKEIVDAAESMYYYGEPSRTTIKVYIPDGITEVNLGNKELSFKVRTKGGVADMFYASSVELQGDIPTSYGFHYITIEAREGYVWVNST